MKIVTILCQKGGVGKTTFTVNLGKILSNRGFKTLIIDTDPQGNVSTYLNFNKDEVNIINSTDLLEKNYDKKIGSLEAGKDATLFISNGDPLEIRTNIIQAYIQGKKIDMDDRHKSLYSKYKEKYRQLDILKE